MAMQLVGSEDEGEKRGGARFRRDDLGFRVGNISRPREREARERERESSVLKSETEHLRDGIVSWKGIVTFLLKPESMSSVSSGL